MFKNKRILNVHNILYMYMHKLHIDGKIKYKKIV